MDTLNLILPSLSEIEDGFYRCSSITRPNARGKYAVRVDAVQKKAVVELALEKGVSAVLTHPSFVDLHLKHSNVYRWIAQFKKMEYEQHVSIHDPAFKIHLPVIGKPNVLGRWEKVIVEKFCTRSRFIFTSNLCILYLILPLKCIVFCCISPIPPICPSSKCFVLLHFIHSTQMFFLQMLCLFIKH